MHEVLALFLTPATTQSISLAGRRLDHAQRGLRTCIGLDPTNYFYEQEARVYVVRVQIDIEHLLASKAWPAPAESALREAHAQLEVATEHIDELRHDRVCELAAAALRLLGRCWRNAA